MVKKDGFMAWAKGFTLLEVLISAVLIIVGVGSIGLTVVSLRRSFKDSEDRSRAMRLASSKIEEFLAKGYSYWDESSLLSDNEDGFGWSLKVSAETASGSIANIPYKKAEAVVSYTADKGSGGINTVKNIRLTNILPYPIMHATSVKLGVGSSDDAQVPWESSAVSEFSDASVVGPEDTDDDGDGVYLRLENLRYNVKKDIQVIYSIALNVDDSSIPPEIQSTDTVYTACFLDDVQVGLVSRTPLRSQPAFSNNLVLADAEKDKDHKIEIRWYYSNMYKKGKTEYDSAYTAVKIRLREAILTVLSAEKK